MSALAKVDMDGYTSRLTVTLLPWVVDLLVCLLLYAQRSSAKQPYSVVFLHESVEETVSQSK